MLIVFLLFIEDNNNNTLGLLDLPAVRTGDWTELVSCLRIRKLRSLHGASRMEALLHRPRLGMWTTGSYGMHWRVRVWACASAVFCPLNVAILLDDQTHLL